jgi:hypothetical protein
LKSVPARNKVSLDPFFPLIGTIPGVWDFYDYHS